MSELTNGWVLASIADVTAEPTQRVPAFSEEFTYIDIASIDRDTKAITAPQRLRGDKAPSRARKVVRTGDVLVSMTRPNLNAVALVSPEFDGQIASTGFDVLRPTGVDPRWIFGIVRSHDFIRAMSDLVQGALYPAVRSSDVRAYTVPLAPLSEQKRIADKLDTVLASIDACRERLDRVPQILKKFREAVLEAAVSGRLTEEWRQVHGSGPWKTLQLSTVCRSITDGDHQAPPQASSGVPFITISAINDGQLRLEKATRYVPKQYFDSLKSERRPEVGDILFSVTGSIGIPALVDSPKSFAFQRHIAILKPDNLRVSSRFLLYTLASRAIGIQAKSVATGTAQLTIPLTGLRQFEISIPDLKEQSEVVRRINALFALSDTIERRYADAVTQTEKLTPSVLAKAFRGELVPQDPNDEPAGEMLKRIRKLKETPVANKPKIRKTPKTVTGSGNLKAESSKIASPSPLRDLLKKPRRLRPEQLLALSGLEIDQFYDQLKIEEANGLLREVRSGKGDVDRWLEVVR